MIQIDGEVKVQAIRREGAARIEQIKRDAAAVRRREEQLTVEDVEGAMRIYSGPSLAGRGKTPIKVAQKFHRINTERSGAPLEPYHGHVIALATARQIEIRWTAIPGTNAYAFRDRAIEIPPVRSEFSYAVALHELAHVERPCQPHHRRVARKAGGGTVCVQCEITAWEHATELARPAWTAAMHHGLIESLPTYRSFGTLAEQQTIDRMCTAAWRIERRKHPNH
jgi:hypothetical protein